MRYPIKFMSLSSSVVTHFPTSMFRLKIIYIPVCLPSPLRGGGGVQKMANTLFITDKEQNKTQPPKNPGFNEAVSDLKVTKNYTSFMNSVLVLYLMPRRLVDVCLHFRGTHSIRHYS